MATITQKIVTATEEKFDELKDRSVEKARENFSRLPSFLMEQITGTSPSPESYTAPKNYTSFNEEIRAQLGLAFNQQDAPKLDETRSKLAAYQNQMNFVRKEEQEAREYMQRKAQERSQAEAEVDDQKRFLEAQQKQAMSSVGEPTTKASRGQEKRKKPDQTMENKASFGKQ